MLLVTQSMVDTRNKAWNRCIPLSWTNPEVPYISSPLIFALFGLDALSG